MINGKQFVGVCVVAMLVGAVSSKGLAQRGSPNLMHDGQSIDAMIAEFMCEHEIPGMALAIVQAPYITRATGHGFSAREEKRLVAGNTVFGIGDMAAAYTAVAVMQLVELGKVALDAPIERYVPETPKSWHGVTVRQLVHRQDGLPEATMEELGRGEMAADVLAPVVARPRVFAPGTGVRASAAGHVLLQFLVEAASGERYERFVRAHQFERLGLRHTFFASELGQVRRETLASGERHRRFLQEPGLIDPTEPAVGYCGTERVALTIEGPRGFIERTALYSSASDISVWDIGLAGNILIKDPALRAVLYAPAKTSDGRATASSGAWWFPGHRGLMIATGSGGGFSALLSRFTDPAELLCVTLLANKEGVDLTQLARRIAAAHDPALGASKGTERMRVQQSPYPVGMTLDRLEAALRRRGATILARIDHAKAATGVKLSLPATEEIVFGNPAAGTLLMQARPAAVVELPLRVAAWEEGGAVWLAGTDPVEIARRVGVQAETDVARAMRAGLDAALLEAVAGAR